MKRTIIIVNDFVVPLWPPNEMHTQQQRVIDDYSHHGASHLVVSESIAPQCNDDPLLQRIKAH